VYGTFAVAKVHSDGTYTIQCTDGGEGDYEVVQRVAIKNTIENVKGV
jgi:hypothetical protein